MRMRRHQEEVDRLCRAVTGGAAGLTDILAAVTPAAASRRCRSSPRAAAGRQPAAGRAGLLGGAARHAPPAGRGGLRRPGLARRPRPRPRVRAAENAPDPCRGLPGYVTTYQASPPRPSCTCAEFRRHRYLLSSTRCTTCLPGRGRPPRRRRPDDEASPGRAPSCRCWRAAAGAAAAVRHAGAGGRAGDPLAALPPRPGGQDRGGGARGARLGGGRLRGAQALAEQAVLPVDFGALDGEAEWLDEERRRLGPHRLSGHPRAAAAGAVHRAAHRLRPRPAAAGLRRDPRPARHRAGRSACGRARPPCGSASCWWWRPTRRMPGTTSARCAAGCRGPGRRVALATSDERDAVDAGRLPAAAGALDPGHRRDGL